MPDQNVLLYERLTYSDSWKILSKIVLCSSIATVMTWVGWEWKGCMFGLRLNTIGANKFWALLSKSIGTKRWIEDPILYICNQPFAVASLLFWPVACSLFLIVFSGTSAVHMARMTHMFDRPLIIYQFKLAPLLLCFPIERKLNVFKEVGIKWH